MPVVDIAAQGKQSQHQLHLACCCCCCCKCAGRCWWCCLHTCLCSRSPHLLLCEPTAAAALECPAVQSERSTTSEPPLCQARPEYCIGLLLQRIHPLSRLPTVACRSYAAPKTHIAPGQKRCAAHSRAEAWRLVVVGVERQTLQDVSFDFPAQLQFTLHPPTLDPHCIRLTAFSETARHSQTHL